MESVVFEEENLPSEEALAEGLSDWVREDLELLTVISIGSGTNRLGRGGEASMVLGRVYRDCSSYSTAHPSLSTLSEPTVGLENKHASREVGTVCKDARKCGGTSRSKRSDRVYTGRCNRKRIEVRK
jgi:hypothetical protein